MWVKTDDLQFVKQVSDEEFTVLEVNSFGDDYVLQEVSVDFSRYTDTDLEHEIQHYYPSLSSVKEASGKDWKCIVAEIIAEQTPLSNEDFRCETNEQLLNYLKRHYDIDVDNVL